ncbi:MAG: hypothetical protein ACR2QJ_04335 [Geminicoccaceae bacterium]
MRSTIAVFLLLAVTACSGVRGVEYSTVNYQPLPAGKTVALDVVLPDSETDEFWLTAERKIHSRLALELEEEGQFQRVLHAGEPADYDMTVQVAEIEVDRPGVAEETTVSDDKLVKAVAAVVNAANAAAAVKLPDQVRSVKVYTTLSEQRSGREVVAFRAEGSEDRTDSTVTTIIDRIVAGITCYGEDCA